MFAGRRRAKGGVREKTSVFYVGVLGRHPQERGTVFQTISLHLHQGSATLKMSKSKKCLILNWDPAGDMDT